MGKKHIQLSRRLSELNTLITILSYILVGALGFLIGWGILFYIGKKKQHSGIIRVIPEEGKLIYSLELQEDPIILQDMKEVIFKVETSDESS